MSLWSHMHRVTEQPCREDPIIKFDATCINKVSEVGSTSMKWVRGKEENNNEIPNTVQYWDHIPLFSSTNTNFYHLDWWILSHAKHVFIEERWRKTLHEARMFHKAGISMKGRSCVKELNIVLNSAISKPHFFNVCFTLCQNICNSSQTFKNKQDCTSSEWEGSDLQFHSTTWYQCPHHKKG